MKMKILSFIIMSGPVFGEGVNCLTDPHFGVGKCIFVDKRSYGADVHCSCGQFDYFYIADMPRGGGTCKVITYPFSKYNNAVKCTPNSARSYSVILTCNGVLNPSWLNCAKNNDVCKKGEYHMCVNAPLE